MTLAANTNRSDSFHAISVEAITGEPYAECWGAVHFGGFGRSLPKTTTSSTGGTQWSWQVPRRISAGRWQIKVECVVARHRQQKTISILAERGRGPGDARHLFVPHTLRSAPVDVSAEDEPGGSGEGVGGGLYPVGQCTWWVAHLRPDLPYFRGRSGDALNWAKSAAGKGWPVGPTPVVGAVAVFQPGQHEAGPAGHVAYVTKVIGDEIEVSEAHFEGHHPGYRRKLGWSGLQFIYKKQTETEPKKERPETKPPPEEERHETAKVLDVVHYSCPFATPTINHTVEPGQHWGTAIISQGTAITGGALYLAAQDDLPEHGSHHAIVGVYADESMTTKLGGMEVTVPIGGTGISFTFPHAIPVLYNQRVFVEVTAIQRFTAYDVDQSEANPSDPDGCFIGRIEGTSPPVYSEQESLEVTGRSFLNYTDASGEGEPVEAGAHVLVFCKIYAPSIASVSPDGYWYRLASAPWMGEYYAAANTFLNGDPPGGPYSHNTDFAVPDC